MPYYVGYFPHFGLKFVQAPSLEKAESVLACNAGSLPPNWTCRVSLAERQMAKKLAKLGWHGSLDEFAAEILD